MARHPRKTYGRIRNRLKLEILRRQRSGSVPRPQRFVFIVTYGRTGSTLLQKLLNTFPGTYVAGENYNVMRGLFEAWRNANRTREEHGKSPQGVGSPWHGAMVVDPDSFRDGLGELFVRTILKPPPGMTTVGFKEVCYLTPDLAEQLDFMAKAFAPALFIFNRRNVGAVAKSGWWRFADHAKLQADVATFDAATAAYAAQHSDRCLQLDYDEWTKDPEALRPLYDFLGQPFDLETVAAVLSVPLVHMQPTAAAK